MTYKERQSDFFKPISNKKIKTFCISLNARLVRVMTHFNLAVHVRLLDALEY